jgi:asparagine synthase (glutamine-hydrolysing)
MCGIVGGLNFPFLNNSIKECLSSISHRGPDDKGFWESEQLGVVLGHARLSILDLSINGHQPMHSECLRYVIVFNGEIYNHQKIRNDLSDDYGVQQWRSNSDTETLLRAIGLYGLDVAVSKCIGMFAFAIWDKNEKELSLVRDRMGEKPLYYGWLEGKFFFASELKAIKVAGFKLEIDRSSLDLYFRHNYIPAPYSIYKGIKKLKPGYILTLSLAGNGVNNESEKLRAFWSLSETVSKGATTPYKLTDIQIADQLEGKLRDSVALQIEADVPVGAFLSGGIDSSLITAMITETSSKPVNTFTIGFENHLFNEATLARDVAKHLKTNHTELYVTPRDALDAIPSLPNIYCEPFADSSQIPTFLVSKLAHQDVSVCLSGDAGDELFGGYNRYVATSKYWGRISSIPRPVRSLLGGVLGAPQASTLNSIVSGFDALTFSKFNITNPVDKLQKLSSALGAHNINDFYTDIVNHWKGDSLVLALNERRESSLFSSISNSFSSPESWMMAMDMDTYLPDDILVKVDRASMANSLEARVPFLDHRIVEFAAKIPVEQKIKNGKGKVPLREVLYRYVPKKLIDRPKRGFTLPLGEWLRGPLKGWAETLLDERKLRGQGYLNVERISSTWNNHISGKENNETLLWSVLMFQAWLENE